MKYNALMYYGQKYFGFEELEMPACGENDMIVKNLTASICGSDTDTWLTAASCIICRRAWNSATRSSARSLRQAKT